MTIGNDVLLVFVGVSVDFDWKCQHGKMVSVLCQTPDKKFYEMISQINEFQLLEVVYKCTKLGSHIKPKVKWIYVYIECNEQFDLNT